MTRIVIHVGVHKTGSTSIQKALNASRKNLLRHGVKLYPGRNHSWMFRMFTDNPECFHHYYRSWGRNTDQQRLTAGLKAYFLNNPGVDHLVSGEDICLLSESALSAFRTFLCEECGISEITIVCYLRTPLDYLNSSLQEYIKSGQVTLDELIGDNLNGYRLQGCPVFSGGLQDILLQIYLPIPQKLVVVFGQENVQFIRFETAIRTGLVRGVLDNFKNCENVGVDNASPSNPSMSHEACLLLAEYNNRNPLLFDNLDVNRKRVKNRVVSTIAAIPGTPARLLNPSNIDLDQINTEICRVNCVAGFEVLEPVPEFPKKYRNNNLFTLSRESITYLDRLVDMSGWKRSEAGSGPGADEIAGINRMLEKNHGTFWESWFSKQRRRLNGIRESGAAF